MKTETRILIAFLLNLFFSAVEFAGGLLTGSIAIVSDALHDLGDAVSIGIAFALEKKSRRPADGQYTFGYARYSVIGSAVTTLILLAGSLLVICNAVRRLIEPTEVDRTGMIAFAAVGVCVNLAAAFFTREGDSLNRKAVNLHMLEDVLGWAVVLAGAVVMHFTDLTVIDPLMSLGVAVFILVSALGNLQETMGPLLEKVPCGMDAQALRAELMAVEGVRDVHLLRVWSLDGQAHCAAMHAVTDAEPCGVKRALRAVLHAHGIDHVTLELEAEGERCGEELCCEEKEADHRRHHHHHHHRHRHHHHSHR